MSKDLLPLYVIHGQSRRAFMRQMSLFVIVTTAILAVLMTLGYQTERLLYDTMGWHQVVASPRLFTASDQLVPIFLTYQLLFLGLILAGAIGAAGFYRSREAGVVAFCASFLLVVLVLLTVEGYALGWMEHYIPGLDLPLALIGISAGGIVIFGFILLWGFIRDMPVRLQTI